MKHHFSLILVLLITLPSLAHASFHSIVIYNESNEMKLSIVVPDKPGPIATFTVSTFDEATQTQPVLTKIESSNAVIFANPKTDSFTGLRANLGGSGKIEVEATGNGDKCFVTSTIREFYLPKKTVIECFYAFILGPKPAFTGSN